MAPTLTWWVPLASVIVAVDTLSQILRLNIPLLHEFLAL